MRPLVLSIARLFVMPPTVRNRTLEAGIHRGHFSAIVYTSAV